MNEEEEEEEEEDHTLPLQLVMKFRKQNTDSSPLPRLSGLERRTCMGRVIETIYIFPGHDPKVKRNKYLSVLKISPECSIFWYNRLKASLLFSQKTAKPCAVSKNGVE